MAPFASPSAPVAQAILDESAGAEIIVVRAPIPLGIAPRERGLRALIRHGAGLDMINVDEATAAGVLVANVPGANALTVAEHVIWTAMALLRRYPQVSRDLPGPGWAAARAHADAGRELSGRTLGILGLGSIGKALARIARHGFGMPVIAHTRSGSQRRRGARRSASPSFCSASDVLALCAPLTAETRGMIDAAALARMKPGRHPDQRGAGAAGGGSGADRRPGTRPSGRCGAGCVRHAAAAAGPSVHVPAECHPDPAHGRDHRGKHAADGAGRGGRGAARAGGGLPENLVNPARVPLYRNRFPA